MRKLNKTLKFTVSSGFDDTHKPTEFVRIKIVEKYLVRLKESFK